MEHLAEGCHHYVVACRNEGPLASSWRDRSRAMAWSISRRGVKTCFTSLGIYTDGLLRMEGSYQLRSAA